VCRSFQAQQSLPPPLRPRRRCAVGCPEHLFTIGGGDYQPSQGGQAKLDWILRTLPLSGRQGAWGGSAERIRKACPLKGPVSRFPAYFTDHWAEGPCSSQFGTTFSVLSLRHHGMQRRSRDTHHEQGSYVIRSAASHAIQLTGGPPTPVWLLLRATYSCSER
jgi:hypothetical protein